jgi:glycerate kinase
VARAIATGWRAVRPDDEVRLLPMADGGEGTLDAFEVAVAGAERRAVSVLGPDDRIIEASWLLLPDRIGVVELAETSGITLLDPLRPMTAHTVGFGQAIAAALDHGVTRLLLAIGGSSSTDGGVGTLRALGGRFLDESGAETTSGGGSLAQVSRVDLTELRGLPDGGVEILSDVTNPLLGSSGAAAVFGPQKGADPDQIEALEAGLAHLAGLIDVSPDVPGAGAAGGTGYGLLAWGATLAPGAGAVGDALGVPAAVSQADLIITGEGRFDSQSAAGKVPSYLAELAGASGIPAYLVAGLITASTDGLFSGAESLTERAGSSDTAIADPLRYLREAGAALAGAVRH